MNIEEDIKNLLAEDDEPSELGNKQLENIIMRLHQMISDNPTVELKKLRKELEVEERLRKLEK